jgi:hypothetical protein
MTTPSPDEILVGLIALAAAPWLGWRLRRGLGEDKLPIGRGYVHRAEREGAFYSLFALYVAAALGMAFIGLDLLFGFAGRS